MKKQLTNIAPLRAGIILGVIYGCLGLIAAPFFVLAALVGARAGGNAILGGIAFAIMLPILYAICGFIGGIIVAAIYNLVVKWTGGLEFEVRDVPTNT